MVWQGSGSQVAIAEYRLCQGGAMKISVQGFAVDRELVMRVVAQSGDPVLRDRVERGEPLREQDWKLLKRVASDCFNSSKQLRKEPPGVERERKLQRLNDFRVPFKRVQDAICEGQAKLALEAAGFGGLPVLAAYRSATRMSKRSWEQLLRVWSEETRCQGNRAEPLAGEQVWQAMSRLLASQGAVEAQFFELSNPAVVARLIEMAAEGRSVRCNLDPGRWSKVGTADGLVQRCLTVLQLVEGGVGVSLFPVKSALGSVRDLMHRKGLRVGERFLLSGMNANPGSGENADAGYLLEGPAARKLSLNFARDVELSAGVDAFALWGARTAVGLRLSRRGLALLGGAAELVTVPPGCSLAELWADEKVRFPLSTRGMEALRALTDRVVSVLRGADNLQRLGRGEPVEGAPVGERVVTVADLPAEREAELLRLVSGAQRFIYVAAHVLTRGVAAALLARKAEVGSLDLRVLVDPGFYFAGTPSAEALLLLEDAGVTPRFALLPRAGEHDRKLHAKQMMTDTGEFVGSTNFSQQALHRSHEQSVVMHGGSQESVASFLELWENFSVEVRTLERALSLLSDCPEAERDAQLGRLRCKLLAGMQRAIGEWEAQSAIWTEARLLGLDEAVAQGLAEGLDESCARHRAVRGSLGDEKYVWALRRLPGYRAISEAGTPRDGLGR